MLQRREGQRHPADLLHSTLKKYFRRAAHLEGPPSPRNNLLLGSLSVTATRGCERASEAGGASKGADTTSGRADSSIGLADTSSAQRQGWSGPVRCCSGMRRKSVLLYSCNMPGNVIFRPPQRRPRGSSPACARGGGTCSPDRGTIEPGSKASRRTEPGARTSPWNHGFQSKIRLPSKTNTIPIPVQLPAFQGYFRQYR